MTRAWIASFALVALTACGDPLAGVERLSDVPLAETDAAPAALPSDDEVTNPEPVLGRLIDEAATTEDSAPVEAEAQSRGLFGRLFGAGRTAATNTSPDTQPIVAEEAPAAPDSTKAVAAAEANAAGALSDSAPEDSVASVVEAADAAPARGGFLGLFRRPAQDQDAPRTAALAPQTDPAPLAAPETDRSSRFGSRPSRRGVALREVPYGTVLPYGEVARVCSAKRQELGRRMARAPRTRGYTLYDSLPDAAGPRTWYVTGFSDGCPRQFTAALAVFGAPSMHEQLRYGLPADEYPYSDTDKAYERIKSRICGVAKRKPCGAKLSSVERNTIFISTYERFGDNTRWADILLHDGEVVASAIKTP